MKTKIFIGLCFMIVFFSCCKQKASLRSILSVDCYWDILNKESIHPVNSCFRFSKDGRCNFYYYNFFDKKKTDSIFQYDDGDVVIPNKWNLIEDTILIREAKYHVIKYSSDSVFLSREEIDTMILIKNCATFNSKEK